MTYTGYGAGSSDITVIWRPYEPSKSLEEACSIGRRSLSILHEGEGYKKALASKLHAAARCLPIEGFEAYLL